MQSVSGEGHTYGSAQFGRRRAPRGDRQDQSASAVGNDLEAIHRAMIEDLRDAPLDDE
jgi:hypothetical protein